MIRKGTRVRVTELVDYCDFTEDLEGTEGVVLRRKPTEDDDDYGRMYIVLLEDPARDFWGEGTKEVGLWECELERA